MSIRAFRIDDDDVAEIEQALRTKRADAARIKLATPHRRRPDPRYEPKTKNHCDEDGAYNLASRIYGYWQLRGYDVVVSVRGPTAGGFGASHWKGIYSVRSTMIGGYPSALQRRPLEEMDR